MSRVSTNLRGIATDQFGYYSEIGKSTAAGQKDLRNYTQCRFTGKGSIMSYLTGTLFLVIPVESTTTEGASGRLPDDAGLPIIETIGHI